MNDLNEIINNLQIEKESHRKSINEYEKKIEILENKIE
jgi:hypothetical protein